MDPNTLKAYQSLGVIHLLAVSGLHVGLVSGSLYILFIRIGMTKERTIDLLIVLLPMYVILAGGAPSVIRAASMFMIILLTMRFRLKINPLDGISIVFLVLLLINPQNLFHLGFQLSFLVSYTLIISAPTILQRYSNWFLQLTAVTILAQFVSFPIVIYNFYEISLWSLPLNLIYIPFITFFTLPLAFFIFISHIIFSPISEPFLFVYEVIIELAHIGLEKALSLPFLTLTFGRPPLYIIVFYYVAIGYLFLLWEKATTLRFIVKGGICFLFVAILHWNLPYLISDGEVTMLDVGQGDSIYIELPKRKAIYVIDTGGNAEIEDQEDWRKRKQFDVGETILLPYVKAKGVRKIDKLILTHGHIDHIGGAEALIGRVPVEKLLYGKGPVEGEVERFLLEKFKQSGTEIQFVKKGDNWRINEAIFQILSPSGQEATLNDRSIVIYARLDGLNWLFTGDLEASGENVLIKSYPSLNVDVLKVGHHGSKTSTTEQLLKAITPTHALIPVGRNNRFGHPHLDVLNRLKKQNVTVLRTDLHGAIRYVFKKGFFETVISSKKRKSP